MDWCWKKSSHTSLEIKQVLSFRTFSCLLLFWNVLVKIYIKRQSISWKKKGTASFVHHTQASKGISARVCAVTTYSETSVTSCSVISLSRSFKHVKYHIRVTFPPAMMWHHHICTHLQSQFTVLSLLVAKHEELLLLLQYLYFSYQHHIKGWYDQLEMCESSETNGTSTWEKTKTSFCIMAKTSELAK
jgi:hypothetical protein